MTTPTGNITLGNVATELVVGLPLTLGDGRCRALANVPSGPISLGQLRGKSIAAAPVHPARGTPVSVYPSFDGFRQQRCEGYNLIGAYADGSGGYYEQVDQANSANCGFNPPARGTLLRYSCQGTTLIGHFADGNYGEYTQAVEQNSRQCGWTPPPRGTFLGSFCAPYKSNQATGDGGDFGGTPWELWGLYTDGQGGTYEALIDLHSVECGFQSDGGFGGG